MEIIGEMPNLAPLSDSSAASSIEMECERHLSASCAPSWEPGTVEVPVMVINPNNGLRRDASFESVSSHTVAEKKRVSFGHLHMRRYQVVVGDHPDCSSGPPISLGWEHTDALTVSIDLYESQRPPRRNVKALQLDWVQRKRVLRGVSDASDEEMRDAASEARFVKLQRKQTVKRLPLASLEAAAESLCRKVLRGSWNEKRL